MSGEIQTPRIIEFCTDVEALRRLIDDGNADKVNELLDYQTVENAMESLLSGKEWGDYLKSSRTKDKRYIH